MKTDSLFYRLFQEFPGIFFELLGSSSEDALNYQFTSQEVKQFSFRLDGLFLPKKEETNQPFYLVEVQFQPDEDLYYRLFSELFLYLRLYKLKQPWQIVVIYPTKNIEREESLQFGDILALDRVQFVSPDEDMQYARHISHGFNPIPLVKQLPTTCPIAHLHQVLSLI